jgi:hypothetical protein
MIRTRLVAVSVMLVGLLFLYGPTPLFAGSFPNDTYPHFGKLNGGCAAGTHMDNLESIGNSPQTFTLCAQSSGATAWQAEIRTTGGVSVCSFPYTTNNGNPVTSPQTFSCSINNNGYYKGYIYYWVGESVMMSHLDQYFKKP